MTFEPPMRVDNFHVEGHWLDYVRFRLHASIDARFQKNFESINSFNIYTCTAVSTREKYRSISKY